jgi:hypothetical protein
MAVLLFERQDEFRVLLLQCVHVIVVLLVQDFLILLVLGRELLGDFSCVVLATEKPTDRAARHDPLPTKATISIVTPQCMYIYIHTHKDIERGVSEQTLSRVKLYE